MENVPHSHLECPNVIVIHYGFSHFDGYVSTEAVAADVDVLEGVVGHQSIGDSSATFWTKPIPGQTAFL